MFRSPLITGKSSFHFTVEKDFPVIKGERNMADFTTTVDKDWTGYYANLKCSTGLTIFLTIKNAASLVMVIIGIIAIYQHIKSHKKTTLQLPRSMYCLTITFYVLTIMNAMSLAFTNKCLPGLQRIYFIPYLIWYYTWYFQTAIILLLLFKRLRYAFEGSVFTLSKASIYTFRIIYTLYILGALFSFSKVIIICYNIIFVTLTIYLSTLFIHKLNQINIMLYSVSESVTDIGQSNQSKDAPNLSSVSTASNSAGSTSSLSSVPDTNNNSNSQFLTIITKSTILTTMSVVSSLTTTIFYFVYYVLNFEEKTEDRLIVNTWNTLVFIDVCTNFLAVYFSSVDSKKYYLFLCGICDSFCKAKCAQCHEKQTTMKELADYVDKTASNTNKKENEKV